MIYREVADGWQMLDNSDAGNTLLIASGKAGLQPVIVDENGWNMLMEKSR